LGAKWHIPHGNACSMTLPQTLDLIAPAVPEKVKFITEALGGTVPADAMPEQIGKIACDTAKRFMSELKLPNLKSYNLTLEQMLPLIADEVTKAVAGAVKALGQAPAPIPVDVAIVTLLVTRAYNEN
jgi:alcohol dehydrogenase class IV